ncbi:unnamed protein product [Rotaria sordida]|uniref:Uncharacterized protein n=1 Tax=Rotaria sordida TaxID=392033 RepID=A0A814RPX2_9BILA|nr:unnamed protein product [Rotaria sordida]CAF1364034.1 unnamed protein product [Rotaria sordida]
MNISSSLLSCSIDTLTIPFVSQLIKEFEARTISTPYVSTQDFTPNDNDVIPNGAESNCFQQMFARTIKIKKYQDQFIGDKEQIDQTLNNDRYKRELPSSSSSSSLSYYSIDSNNNNYYNNQWRSQEFLSHGPFPDRLFLRMGNIGQFKIYWAPFF